MDIIRLRNAHPAFEGRAHVEIPSEEALAITWKNGDHWAKLDVSFSEPRALITYSPITAENKEPVGRWESQAGAIALETT